MSLFKESSRDISVLSSQIRPNPVIFTSCFVVEFRQLNLARCKNKFSRKKDVDHNMCILELVFISLEVECVGKLLVPEVTLCSDYLYERLSFGALQTKVLIWRRPGTFAPS